MAHGLLRADGDMNAAQDDALPGGAQGVSVAVHRLGVLGRNGEPEGVAFQPDSVRLLVHQRRLNGLGGDGIQNREGHRRLREVGHGIEPLQLLHDVDEYEFHCDVIPFVDGSRCRRPGSSLARAYGPLGSSCPATEQRGFWLTLPIT
jgi:hypothetical protein